MNSAWYLLNLQGGIEICQVLKKIRFQIAKLLSSMRGNTSSKWLVIGRNSVPIPSPDRGAYSVALLGKGIGIIVGEDQLTSLFIYSLNVTWYLVAQLFFIIRLMEKNIYLAKKKKCRFIYTFKKLSFSYDFNYLFDSFLQYKKEVDLMLDVGNVILTRRLNDSKEEDITSNVIPSSLQTQTKKGSRGTSVMIDCLTKKLRLKCIQFLCRYVYDTTKSRFNTFLQRKQNRHHFLCFCLLIYSGIVCAIGSIFILCRKKHIYCAEEIRHFCLKCNTETSHLPIKFP